MLLDVVRVYDVASSTIFASMSSDSVIRIEVEFVFQDCGSNWTLAPN